MMLEFDKMTKECVKLNVPIYKIGFLETEKKQRAALKQR